MTKKAEKVYQFKIWLMDIEPQIWRKFEVFSNIPLDKLHIIIQAVMGWKNAHFHGFNAGGGIRYGKLDPDSDGYNDEILDESKAKLTNLVTKPKDRFTYDYDYGDGWSHMVELLKIREPQDNAQCPVCLEGS